MCLEFSNASRLYRLLNAPITNKRYQLFHSARVCEASEKKEKTEVKKKRKMWAFACTINFICLGDNGIPTRFVIMCDWFWPKARPALATTLELCQFDSRRYADKRLTASPHCFLAECDIRIRSHWVCLAPKGPLTAQKQNVPSWTIVNNPFMQFTRFGRHRINQPPKALAEKANGRHFHSFEFMLFHWAAAAAAAPLLLCRKNVRTHTVQSWKIIKCQIFVNHFAHIFRPTTMSQLTEVHMSSFVPFATSPYSKLRSNYNVQLQCGGCAYIIRRSQIHLFVSFVFSAPLSAHQIECSANTWSQGSCRAILKIRSTYSCSFAKMVDSTIAVFFWRKREQHRN